MNIAVLHVYSEEAGRENQDMQTESTEPGRCHKLPRISDTDMFGSDIAERQHMSNDMSDNYVHSSGEIEVIPPSLESHSEPSCIQNTKPLMGSSSVLDSELGKQQQNVVSYPDLEMLNDVEPDGLQCVKPFCHEENSRHRAIVTVVDSSPVILTRRLSADKCDKVMPSSVSVSSIVLEKGASLPVSQGVSASNPSLSDDGTQFNTESHSIADDATTCDLVTQSSTADHQSFQSCSTVDLDSSLVSSLQLLIYLCMSCNKCFHSIDIVGFILEHHPACINHYCFCI